MVYSTYMAPVLSKAARLLLVVLLGTFSFAHFSYAELPCGDIIAPAYYFGPSQQSNLTSVSITDCEDPFGVTSLTAPYVLKVNGNEVLDGETANVDLAQALEIEVLGTPTLDDYQIYLFRHDNNNYQYTELYPETDEGLILEVGTYTMVIKEYELILSEVSPWQRFLI